MRTNNPDTDIQSDPRFEPRHNASSCPGRHGAYNGRYC